jgi:hypothetical protein
MADDLKRTQKRNVLERMNHKTMRFPADARELREIAPELAKETDDPLVRFEILLGGVPDASANPNRWIDAAGKAWHVLRAQRPDVARRLTPTFGDDTLFSCDDALPPPAFEWTLPRGEVLLRLARADRDGLRQKIESAFADTTS